MENQDSPIATVESLHKPERVAILGFEAADSSVHMIEWIASSCAMLRRCRHDVPPSAARPHKGISMGRACSADLHSFVDELAHASDAYFVLSFQYEGHYAIRDADGLRLLSKF